MNFTAASYFMLYGCFLQLTRLQDVAGLTNWAC